MATSASCGITTVGRLSPPAPIFFFDNGLSLFCYARKEDYAHLDEYAKTCSNPYNISYEEVCAEVMGAKQKEQLRRMIGFRFKRHESLNLPEEHLQAIEKHLEGWYESSLPSPLAATNRKRQGNPKHLSGERIKPARIFGG